MLTSYQTRTRQLLQNPSAPTALYATSDVNSWINLARGQLSGESECVRYMGTISTAQNTREYAFSGISLGTAATNGIKGVIHVRSIRYAVGDGFQWITPRAWEWFDLYHLNNPVPDNGAPADWSQFAQGGSNQGVGTTGVGSFWIDPIPVIVYSLTCDCVCYPQDLVDDTTVEAIPFLFTDAVPFLAAWYALLSAQNNARMADAERMFNYYQTFLQRARQFSNPSVLRGNYEQSVDQTQINKLGLAPKSSQGTG